jgi:uncharacterized protein YciI
MSGRFVQVPSYHAVMRTFTAALVVAVSLAAVSLAQTPPPATPAPLYAAIFKTGPKWDAAKPPGEQAAFREHSANLAKLRAAGAIVMGARYAEIGLVVVTAANEAEARKLFDGDPSIAAGTFTLDVHRFSVFYPGQVGTPPAPK